VFSFFTSPVWRAPAVLNLAIIIYIVGSSLMVYAMPHSLLAFLLFQGSLLALYYFPIAKGAKLAYAAVTLGILMPWLGVINGYYLEVAVNVGIFVALALGLNIVVGLAGLLDLGYVAFYAVGAYLWAVFGSPQANEFISGNYFPLSPPWFFVFLMIGVVAGAIIGVVLGLPVLRLRGDYLAIVTLGFGEVIRVLANNLDRPINFTNGPKGITPIQRPPLFFEPFLKMIGLNLESHVLYALYFYVLVLGIVAIVIVVNRRLERSHIGRAWEAIREDELAAQAMGIPLVRMKLLAFACGASFAGVVGVLFSAKQLFINPESFTFMESIGVLAMVILGGMGSIPGAVLGATVVTVLNLQVLKGLSLWLNSLKSAGTTIWIPFVGQFNLVDLPSQLEPAKYERMVFGVILVLMMIFRPQGIIPRRRKLR
jgi:branched-chain amino acid transport system permease protein